MQVRCAAIKKRPPLGGRLTQTTKLNPLCRPFQTDERASTSRCDRRFALPNRHLGFQQAEAISSIIFYSMFFNPLPRNQLAEATFAKTVRRFPRFPTFR